MDRSDEKKARLAEALRANLKKRKAQSRAESRGEIDSRPTNAVATPPDD